MDKKIVIFCKNTECSKEVAEGVSLSQLAHDFGVKTDSPVLAALVNNRLCDLSHRLFSPKTIEFVEMRSALGADIYARSLWMLAAKALKDIRPDSNLRVEYTISNGFYCTLSCPVDHQLITSLKEKMEDTVRRNVEVEILEERTDVVAERFAEFGATATAQLLRTIRKQYSRYFRIENYIDYYPSVLVPSTGYITTFDVVAYEDGILLVMPDINDLNRASEVKASPHVFKAHKEFNEWNRLMGMNSVGDFNEICRNGGIRNLIKISEALHEKKIAEIAESINQRKPKFVMIAGPSSSGKTTFSKRLEIQLQVIGIKPIVLSVDDFFVDREFTPRDEKGDYDFEHLQALDLKLLGDTLTRLMNGEEVELPQYSFAEGRKFFRGKRIKMTDRSVVVMEGIHALNPAMVPDIPADVMFKIFAAPATAIPFDDHNWMPAADIRLARRILRDYQFRAYSAQNTIKRWPSVRRGEMKWIYPFQENADVIFNSSLLFEFAVLRSYVEPLLRQVPEASDEYATASKLLNYFEYFELVPSNEIPPTSLLREFLGGSSFHY